jgi:hypothetical protein
VIDTLPGERITHTVLVPPMLGMLLDELDREGTVEGLPTMQLVQPAGRQRVVTLLAAPPASTTAWSVRVIRGHQPGGCQGSQANTCSLTRIRCHSTDVLQVWARASLTAVCAAS